MRSSLLFLNLSARFIREKGKANKTVCRAACLLFILLFFVIPLGGCGRNAALGEYAVSVDFDGQTVTGTAEYTLAECDVGEKLVFCYYPAVLCGGTIAAVKLNGIDISVERSGEKGEFIAVCADFKAKDVVYFEYSFTLDESDGRLGITDKTVNFALFYPIKCVKNNGEFVMHEYSAFGDPFYFDYCNLDLRLVVPSVYSVACGGYPEECLPSGDRTTYFYSFKNVKNVAFSVSQVYNVVTKKSGYKSINYYYYDDIAPEETLNEVVCALVFFQKKIGEYAYDILTFAQSPYEYGGMEYSCFFVVGECPERENYLYAAVHETAHQWFPIAVGSDEYFRPCFDEGLAETMSIKYYESKDEARAKNMYLSAKAAYEGYKRNCLAVGKKPLEKQNSPLKEYSSAYEYTVNAYYASSCAFLQAFDSLDGSLKPLKNFYRKNKFRNASERDFYASFPLLKRGFAKKSLKNYV